MWPVVSGFGQETWRREAKENRLLEKKILNYEPRRPRRVHGKSIIIIQEDESADFIKNGKQKSCLFGKGTVP